MSIFLWILVGLVVLTVVAGVTVWISVKRQGKIAQWITNRAMKSSKVQAAVNEQLSAGLQDENSEVMKTLEAQGIGRDQAAQALEAYMNMSKEQQQQVMDAAASGVSPQGLSTAQKIQLQKATRPTKSTAQKRKSNKQARQARKKNR